MCDTLTDVTPRIWILMEATCISQCQEGHTYGECVVNTDETCLSVRKTQLESFTVSLGFHFMQSSVEPRTWYVLKSQD